ncbi:MAG: hypothetical protein JXA66_07345 [Oligoflexia bacterium]|nr:hypothetical protein [Oligoflexia bacterium]
MAGRLTWEEIKQQYPDQWVMLINYKFNNKKIFPSEGEVVAHARTRKEFSELMMKDPATDFSVRYTGQISDGRSVLCKIKR